MPGIRLSQAEQSLIERWKIAAAYKLPRLGSLTIRGGDGVRGIKNLALNLDRPITVLCGSNGCGKSTILSLCRLGFQSIAQFDDLFIEINQAQPFHDFSASWSYLNIADALTFDGAARSYNVPPFTRPVIFIGLSRIIPAWEKSSVVNHFRQNPAWDDQKPLDERHLARLRDMMSRDYTDAAWQVSSGFEIRTCSTAQAYTSFNMCTGEETGVEIFRLLQSAVPESLVLIEDAEVGLNPVAIPKFAKHLVEICLEKRFQIILTTHSLDLLTACPSEFLCLVKPDGLTHQTVDAPALQEILTSISTQVEPDIIVFCEDDVAESLIRQAVSGDFRRRLKMVFGAKSKLLGYAEAHLKAGWPHIPVIVWDGDVNNAETKEWLGKFDAPTLDEINAKVSRIKLPGAEPPERWMLAQLSSDEGCRLLSEELGEDVRTTRAFVGMLSTMFAFHSLSYELAQRTGLDEQAVRRSLTRAIGRLSTNPLEILRQQLERIVNKEIVVDV